MQPKTKTILYIVFSFFIGILVGWFLENRVSSFTHAPQNHRSRNFQKILSERLHLDEQQVLQVDSILEMRKQRMDDFRKQSLFLRDSMRAEIRKKLNPDQVVLFDNFIQNMDKRESRKRGIDTTTK